MKIKVLMENTAADEKFFCGHGLSVYIETADHKILMDAGPDRRFAFNAYRMGVSLADIDIVVLSHGHYDHSGGLIQFLELNDSAMIYAASGYDRPHYNENGAYIGVDPAIIDNPRIKVLDGDLQIDDSVLITRFGGGNLAEPINTCGMTEGEMEATGRVVTYPECFEHEHYLLVSDGGKKVLFTGCSHKGIVNITEWAKELEPDAVFGGFHLMGVKEEDFGILDRIAGELLLGGMDYYTGHCTGQAQYEHMKEIMKDRLNYAAAGCEIVI